MWVLNKGIYENTHFVSDCVNKYVNFQKNSVHDTHRVFFFYFDMSPNLEFLFL